MHHDELRRSAFVQKHGVGPFISASVDMVRSSHFFQPWCVVRISFSQEKQTHGRELEVSAHLEKCRFDEAITKRALMPVGVLLHEEESDTDGRSVSGCGISGWARQVL